MRATVTFEDGKIVCVQKAKKEGQKSTRSVREMNGADEMIYTMTIGDCPNLHLFITKNLHFVFVFYLINSRRVGCGVCAEVQEGVRSWRQL